MNHPHKITKQDFEGFKVAHMIACSYGKGEAKEIRLIVDPADLSGACFTVIDHDAIIYTGTDFDKAIEVYNGQ